MRCGGEIMNRVQELENKVQELLSLLEACKELNSNIEIQEVFQNILLQMVRVIKVEAATLWVLDEEQGIIEASAAYGPTSSAILNIKLNKEEGIVGKVIASKEVHFIEDVSLDPNWAKRVDHSSGFVTRSMITIPLVVKEKALGALQLLNKQGATLFTEEDVNLATILANQSALALHNSQIYEELYTMFMSVIRTLAKILDARDPYTAGHSERVAKYSVWIARKLGVNQTDCAELNRAALLHDIGKIGIPDEILRKTSRLTDEEFAIVKRHPEIGAEILEKMEPKSVMKNAIEVAKYHHERINGTGYPERLKGKEIPFFARIVGVADSFDAMTTVRPYSKGLTMRQAADELLRCKGTMYDDSIVDAFIEILNECDFNPEQYKGTSTIRRGTR